MFLLLSTFKFSSHLKIDLAPALVCPGRQLHVTRHRRELAQDVVMYLWNTATINTHIIGGRPEVYLDVPLIIAPTTGTRWYNQWIGHNLPVCHIVPSYLPYVPLYHYQQYPVL